MAVSPVATFTGDGVTTNFAFGFSYIDQDHVAAYVDGVAANFTWVNGSTVQITPAPSAGAEVIVQRETPRGAPLVNFTDGSVLSERDLDLLSLQTIYIAEELEVATSGLATNNTFVGVNTFTQNLNVEVTGERAVLNLKRTDVSTGQYGAIQFQENNVVMAFIQSREIGGATQLRFVNAEVASELILAQDGSLRYATETEYTLNQTGGDEMVIVREKGDERYVPKFSTVAAAQAASITRYVDTIETKAYSSVMRVGGAKYRRISFADIIADVPSQAYFRSTDRFMPNGGAENATNGGYWIIDENEPTVEMFGAIPDGHIANTTTGAFGGTPATAAIQAWIDWYRLRENQNWESPYQGGPSATGVERIGTGIWKFGYGTFLIDDSLNFTKLGVRGRMFVIDMCGSTILGAMPGTKYPMLDFTDSEYFTLKDAVLGGDPRDDYMPTCAVKTGRIGDNNTAARWTIENIRTRLIASDGQEARSNFRIAALLNIASEESVEHKCIWENWNDSINPSKTYGAAYDSMNYLLYGGRNVVGNINKATDRVTVTAHPFVDGDRVVFAELDWGAGQTDLLSHLYIVRDVTTDTFRLEDPDVSTDGSTRVDMGAFTGTYVINSGRVHREQLPATKFINDRATPWDQRSFLHYSRYGGVYYAPYGRAAVFLGATQQTHFHNCFLVGANGFHIMFGADGDTNGLHDCIFDCHVEGALGGLVETEHYFIFEQLPLPGVSNNVNISTCQFLESGNKSIVSFFYADTDITRVQMLDCTISFNRTRAGFGTMFNDKAKFKLRDCAVTMEEILAADWDDVDFSGTLNSILGETSVVKHRTFNLDTGDTLPDAGIYTGGVIFVRRGIFSPNRKPAYSDGNNWRFFADDALVT